MAWVEKTTGSVWPEEQIGRLFFHIRSDGELYPDPDGVEVRLDDALQQCRQIVIAVLGEEKLADEAQSDREFVVSDELGRTVLVVPFRSLKS